MRGLNKMSISNNARRIAVALMVSGAVVGLSSFTEMNSSARTVTDQDDSDLVGNWSGESICQDRNSPCRDERNVYHISKSRKPGVLNVSADKIVDGRAINMGNLEFKYDKESKALSSESDRATWKLIVNGKTMQGTLTLMPGKRLYRRITLRKDE